MSESLALRYRPQSFDDMIGQKILSVVLQKMVEQGAVPHGLLLSGPSGTGKTTAARILAAELNPSQREAIAGGYSSDVIEIDAASKGNVADIRSLLDTLRYATKAEAKRVVIMDEAHSITREGWNTLLKPTEEEFGVIFVFVTTEPERIPPTVISRLHEFPFSQVTPNDILTRLVDVAKAEKIATTVQLLEYIAVTCRGNVRTALTSFDQAARADIKSVEDYVKLKGLSDESPKLVSALLTGDYAQVFAELDDQLTRVANPSQVTSRLVKLFTDLLVIRAGGSVPYMDQELQVRKDLAVQVEQDRLLSAMKIMWDLKTRVRGSDDASGDVRLVLTLITDVFSRGKAQPVVPASAVPVVPVSEGEPKKLSLADLRKR